MEERIQKLARVLNKNRTWRWLGRNTLLGNRDDDQYSGLKIFISYVVENSESLIENRKDRGVNFISTGENPICRNFIKYLQDKAEKTKNEREKAQLLWMGNRAEAMMQMSDASLGQMNDGIFLAYAFTFMELGEKANPPVEVDESTIVGLLENGMQLARKEVPNLRGEIDSIVGKKKEVPTGGAGTLQGGESGKILKTAVQAPPPTISGTSEITTTAGKAPTGGEIAEGKKEKPTPKKVQKEVEPGTAATEEEKTTNIEGIPGEETEQKVGEELQASLSTGQERKGALQRLPRGTQTTQTKKEINIPENRGISAPVITKGKGKRKKSGKKRIREEKNERGETERQRLPERRPSATGTAAKRKPTPSGGWKIAKRTGKILFGGGIGGGIISWMASSGKATAATLALLHTLH